MGEARMHMQCAHSERGWWNSKPHLANANGLRHMSANLMLEHQDRLLLAFGEGRLAPAHQER
eukprot:126776-Alexandrium_andersonii.AAC.1